MNALNICAPFVLYPAGGLVVYLTLMAFAHFFKHSLAVHPLTFVSAHIIVFITYTLCYALFLVSPLIDGWLRARPTPGWEQAAEETETVAIILGFGYEIGPNGEMLAGEANEALLEWTLAHTNSQIIFVQEGVWVAACRTDESPCIKDGRQILRIHKHAPEQYVNTLDAAFCAMQEMTNRGKDKAILVTHDLQLQRAAWDFAVVQQTNEAWRSLEFVIPDMPSISYVENSEHFQTHRPAFWRAAELLVARPRDFLGLLPTRCNAPLSTPVPE